MMSNFSYALDKEAYTLQNALLWGNCWGHFKEANQYVMKNGTSRTVHVLIGMAELLPIVSQIASLIELLVIKIFSKEELPQAPLPYYHHLILNRINQAQITTTPNIISRINSVLAADHTAKLSMDLIFEICKKFKDLRDVISLACVNQHWRKGVDLYLKTAGARRALEEEVCKAVGLVDCFEPDTFFLGKREGRGCKWEVFKGIVQHCKIDINGAHVEGFMAASYRHSHLTSYEEAIRAYPQLDKYVHNGKVTALFALFQTLSYCVHELRSTQESNIIYKRIERAMQLGARIDVGESPKALLEHILQGNVLSRRVRSGIVDIVKRCELLEHRYLKNE